MNDKKLTVNESKLNNGEDVLEKYFENIMQYLIEKCPEYKENYSKAKKPGELYQNVMEILQQIQETRCKNNVPKDFIVEWMNEIKTLHNLNQIPQFQNKTLHNKTEESDKSKDLFHLIEELQYNNDKLYNETNELRRQVDVLNRDFNEMQEEFTEFKRQYKEINYLIVEWMLDIEKLQGKHKNLDIDVEKYLKQLQHKDEQFRNNKDGCFHKEDSVNKSNENSQEVSEDDSEEEPIYYELTTYYPIINLQPPV